MLASTFLQSNRISNYAFDNINNVDTASISPDRYTGGFFGANITSALQFTQLKHFLGRSASTDSSNAHLVRPKSTFNVVLNGKYSRNDSLAWPAWRNSDSFRVVLPQRSSFNVGITGFKKNVDLQLYTLNGRLLASSKLPGTRPDSINLQSLAAGTYIVRVSLKVPLTDISARTNYHIAMSRSNPSDVLAEEVSLGNLGSTVINRIGAVNSNDTSDIYQFNLGSPAGLNLQLSGLTSNANIRLIKDSNRNGWIDTTDIIADSTEGGITSDVINMRWLTPGSYFVQVHQQGNSATGYSLQFNRRAPVSLSLRPEADAYIRADLDSREDDNYGAEKFLEIGTGRGSSIGPEGTADAMRSLLRFDLSGFSGTLTRATLRLTIDSLDNSTIPYSVGVYKATQPWQEGNGREDVASVVPGSTDTDSAWGVAWSAIDDNNQAQPLFNRAAIDTQVIDSSLNQVGDVIEWDITPLVKGWLANPDSNYGLVLRDLTDLTASGEFRELRFGSRETDLYTFPTEVPGPRLNLQFQ